MSGTGEGDVLVASQVDDKVTLLEVGSGGERRGEESTEFAQNELVYKRSAVNSACQVSVRRGEFPWAACLGCPPLTETLEALGTCYTPTGSRDRACDVDDAVKEARASEGGRGEGKGGEGTGTTNQRNLEQCPQKVNCLK